MSFIWFCLFVFADDTGSIAASIRIEKALSEAPSGTLTATHQFEVMSRSVALLSKLWLITGKDTLLSIFIYVKFFYYHLLFFFNCKKKVK